MANFLFVASVLFLVSCQAPRVSASRLPLGPGQFDLSLSHEGRERSYILYLPKGYSAEKQFPLVLAFHGGGGNARIQATDRFYQFISSADKHGYVVVFPNGTGALGGDRLATWNAGLCCGKARDNKVDDVGFVRALLRELAPQVSFDPKRVFATGMSNGAMMAYRLACEAPELIRAVGAVAGTDNTTSCAPKRAVSILHIHSLHDEHVNFNGGRGAAAAGADQVNEFVSVPATVAAWKKHNACGEAAERVSETALSYCDRYRCKDGARVQLCVTKDGGHSWPGGQKPLARGPRPSQAFNATELIWQFFSQVI